MMKKCILVLMIILTMGITACSSDSKENTAPAETDAEADPAADEENTESDSIIGIVEKYTDNTIVIKDPGDEILYYFSTKNAQIAEGDSPIAVGDKVEITYRGLLGDETNPGEAVKITADTVQ